MTNKQFIIARQSSNNNNLVVSIDITFLHAPCATLRLVRENPIDLGKSIVHSSVEFVRTMENAEEVIGGDYVDPAVNSEYADEDEEVKIMLTGLKNRERCRVRGDFAVQPVPGSFSTSHWLADSYLSQVKKLNAEWYGRLNLAHTINALDFHTSTNNEIIANNFTKPTKCLYYLKVIPKGSHSKNLTQYSFSQACSVLQELIIGSGG